MNAREAKTSSDDELDDETETGGSEDGSADSQSDKNDLIQDQDMGKILCGVDALKHIEWPADPEVQVVLKPLSREEIYQGVSDAAQYVADKGIEGKVYERGVRSDGTEYVVTWEDLIQRDEWIATALRRADNPKRKLFASVSDLRRRLTSDEITRLYKLLSEHMRQVAPLTASERMAKDNMYAKLVESLKKKPGEITLASLPRDILEDLVRFMVIQPSP
jgi:hypothetical protein